MKATSILSLALILPWIFGPGSAAAAPAPDLPEMIRQTKNGVFLLNVLDTRGRPIGSGTGFLVDGEGTLVTALHVIQPQSDSPIKWVEAAAADGRKWEVAGVMAHDESVDLAILKLAKVPEEGQALELAGDMIQSARENRIPVRPINSDSRPT